MNVWKYRNLSIIIYIMLVIFGSSILVYTARSFTGPCQKEQREYNEASTNLGRKQRNLAIITGGVVVAATIAATNAYKAAKPAGMAAGAVAGSPGGPAGMATGAAIGGEAAGLAAAVRAAVSVAIATSPAIAVAALEVNDAQVDKNSKGAALERCKEADERTCKGKCSKARTNYGVANSRAASRPWACGCNYGNRCRECPHYTPSSSSSSSN